MLTNPTGCDTALSRREFMAGTGSILAGAAAAGLAGPAEAAKRHPKRGGTLRFATQADSLGLDPHRNVIYLVSHPLAATTQGLLDLDVKSSPVPGIATEWSISKDVLTYTFKLRKGVLFHNGREVDAAAVKWNYERIQDPKKIPFLYPFRPGQSQRDGSARQVYLALSFAPSQCCLSGQCGVLSLQFDCPG